MTARVTHRYGNAKQRYRYRLFRIHPAFQEAAKVAHRDGEQRQLPLIVFDVINQRHLFFSQSPREVARLQRLASAIGYQGDLFGDEYERFEAKR